MADRATAPVYPRRAARRGIEGYVLLEFTVAASGGVRDLVVLEAAAVRDLRYNPRFLNGRAVDVAGQRRVLRYRLRGGQP